MRKTAQKGTREFLVALLIAWSLAGIGALYYSRQQNIPPALLPALLLELVFYLVPGFPASRRTFDGLGSKATRAALLSISAVLPYLIFSIGAGSFHLLSVALLLAVAGTAAFWYAKLPPSLLSDTLFVIFIGVIYTSPFFPYIYGPTVHHLPVEFLGRLMWIRLTILSVLSFRRLEEAHFGFLPTRKDWRIGFLYFLFFIPVAAVLGYLLHFARFHPLPLVWWRMPVVALAVFCGTLFVLAAMEEFFLRGFILTRLTRGFHSQTAGLIVSSLLFGLMHLPFRGFPNWRFATIAAVSGIFYGLAFQQAKSVRAPMVTHAFVVTTWRLLFS